MVLYTRLREKRFFQAVLAYLGAAWFIMQLLDVLGDRWGVPNPAQRAVDVALLVGLFITLTVSWHHGDKGRQRVTGTELVLVGLCLLLGGFTLSRVSMPPVSEPIVGVLAVEALGLDSSTVKGLEGLHDDLVHALTADPRIRVLPLALTSAEELGRMLYVMGEVAGPELVFETRGHYEFDGRVRVHLRVWDFRTGVSLASDYIDLSASNKAPMHALVLQAALRLIDQGLEAWRPVGPS